MDRLSAVISSVRRAVGVPVLGLMLAVPGVAAAQDPAAAPAQQDLLKFSSSSPALILIQIHVDKAADFEAAWAGIRAGAAKSTNADIKAYGESLSKLFKVDQPPIDGPGGKSTLYVLQLDAPSTSFSYNPGIFVYQNLWENGKEGAALNRAEADAIYEKLKGSLQNINPPWKLIKIG